VLAFVYIGTEGNEENKAAQSGCSLCFLPTYKAIEIDKKVASLSDKGDVAVTAQ
jgi:hypothetical protein